MPTGQEGRSLRRQEPKGMRSSEAEGLTGDGKMRGRD